MSTIEQTTPAPTGFVSTDDDAAAAALPQLLRTGSEGLVIASGRAAVVLVPVMSIFLTFHRTPFGLIEAGGQGAIWFLALRSTFAAAWLSALALGVPTAAALGTMTGLAGVTLFEFWFPGSELKPTELLTMSAGVLVASATFETLAAVRLRRRRGVLIVGASFGGAELAKELLQQPELPFRCLGIVCDEEEADRIPRTLVLGGPAELIEIVRSQRPDIVVLARSDYHSTTVSRLVDSASIGFRLVGVPEFYEHAFGRVPIEYLSPTWFMSVLHLYQHSYSRATKRLLDLVLASAGLLVTVPLLPFIAWLVHRSGPGPVFFRQPRLGEGGRTFEMLKFRTMRDSAEQPGQPQWAVEEDSRATPIGRVLRRTRLDELPQLWNVLRGEMSIVGPRPERPEFLELLKSEVPFWTQRHLIKPGITGWAQVRRGYTSDVGGTADKLSYDLYYLKHRSLTLDLAIAVKTARIVVSGEGAQ
jgi:exopolysaccharide biosynthesis polyprenyl glycosylphosphotransferase